MADELYTKGTIKKSMFVQKHYTAA